MRLGLEGRTALVCGASRGLGRQIALDLAAEGARVVAVARTPDTLAEVIGAMGAPGGHRALAVDLAAEGGPAELVARLDAEGLAPDVVVHNLGGSLGIRTPFPSPDEWQAVWRLNFGVAAELNAALVPRMQRRGWGRVLHVSSVAATLSRGAIAYGTVKAAVNAYVRNLGATVAPDGVVVTSLMPGAIRDPGGHWDRLAKDQPDRVRDYLDTRLAIHRFATPEEVAAVAVFLCSQPASFATGALVPVDGGSW